MTTERAPMIRERWGWLGWPGLAVALLALGLAAGGPWLAERLDPPSREIDEVAADVAGRIKDRMVAKLRGRTYQARPHEDGSRWSRWLPGVAVGLGALGCCLGVLGFVRREDARLVGSAIAVGVGAIVFQYFVMLAAFVLLLLVIGLILSAFGGGI